MELLRIEHIKQENTKFKFFFYWFIFLMLLDLITTYIWISFAGAKEWNSLMHNIVHKYYFIAIILKFIAIFADIYFIEKALKEVKEQWKKKFWIRFTIVSMFLVYLAIQTNNILVILIKTHLIHL